MRHPEKYYMKDVKRTLRSLIDKGNNIIDFFYMKNNPLSSFNENAHQPDCATSIVRVFEKISEKQLKYDRSNLNDFNNNNNNNNNTADVYHNSHHNTHHHSHHLRMTSSNCAWLHCSIGSLSTDESAIIRLRFRVWSRNLAIVSTISYIIVHLTSYD
jgi:hypothetical protein